MALEIAGDWKRLVQFREDLTAALRHVEEAIEPWLSEEHAGHAFSSSRVGWLQSKLEVRQRLLWDRGWRETADDLTAIMAWLRAAVMTADRQARRKHLQEAVTRLRSLRRTLEV